MSTLTYLDAPDGTRIAYHQSAGEGVGVIFLGGFKSDMTGTKAIAIEAWAQANRVPFVRFDYAGHGESSGAFEEGTIGLWKSNALAVLDSITKGKQILVGSSMGGWLMLLLASARPERVAGLLGIAAAPDFTEKLIWEQLTELQKKEITSKGVLHTPSEYGEPYPITLRLIEEGRQHLLLDSPIPITCPVHLLHGMKDADVPWQFAPKIAEKLASTDVQISLSKTGDHRLSAPEDIDRMLQAVETIRHKATKP